MYTYGTDAVHLCHACQTRYLYKSGIKACNVNNVVGTLSERGRRVATIRHVITLSYLIGYLAVMLLTAISPFDYSALSASE